MPNGRRLARRRGAWDVRAAIELRLGRVRGRMLPSNERVDGINIEGSGDMAGI